MDERSPFCAARRSRAQRHRYRLYKGCFFRGYRCATGPPGLSNCWVDIDTPEVTEVGESLELACQNTAQNGDEEAISTEHFENIIVHEAAGGTCDQHGKPNLAETEVLQKAASWEVRGAPAHDLVDEMCLAGTAQPENDGGDAAQSMTSINHRQHKRKLCSSQKHFVKAKCATKRPSADSVLEDSRKYDADVHLLQQQLRGVPAAHSLLHPLDFLDLSDVAALGISCEGNLASELYYDYFQRWASKHGCEDLWDESWNEVMAALV
ncbi:unnamed protein product [Polarella glacialis]|uniref:Uncharacterized protein n=1 Tax=Polarella glacialis TaxID=89957 RepID=A0A813G2D3_POLGL|nr:unnamed protein product [Polarella glacialis]